MCVYPLFHFIFDFMRLINYWMGDFYCKYLLLVRFVVWVLNNMNRMNQLIHYSHLSLIMFSFVRVYMKLVKKEIIGLKKKYGITTIDVLFVDGIFFFCFVFSSTTKKKFFFFHFCNKRARSSLQKCFYYWLTVVKSTN